MANTADLDARTVPARLARAVRDHPGATCRFPGRGEQDLVTLDQRVRQVAQGLAAQGVAKGDRVGIMLSNRPEMLETWLAIGLLGAVGVPFNTALRGDILAAMVEIAGPSCVVTEADLLANLASVSDALPGVTIRLVDAAPGSAPAGLSIAPYAELLSHGVQAEPVEVSAGDPFMIMFTSGTTGPSKGVAWTHGSACQMAEVAGVNLSLTTEDVVYTSLPIFHGNGMVLAVFAGITAGASVVVGRRFSARSFWSEVTEAGATVVNMVGSMAQALWKQPPGPHERAHQLRTALVIPGPPVDQYAAFEERFGFAMTEAFGISDAGMLLWVPPGERRPGSCGKAGSGWECQVVDGEDRPVPVGEIGELVARPLEPSILPLGYWGRPEATLESRRNLWLHTGDRVYRDEDGWYYYVDRMKDAIRRRGENVSSFEVEQILLTHPSVVEVAVYAVPSDLQEDEVMAAVALRDDDSSWSFAELLDHCSARLPYFAMPRYLRKLEVLPKTQTGKVVKADLRADGVTPDTWDREAAGYEVSR